MSLSPRSGPSQQVVLASGLRLDHVEQGDPTGPPLVLLPGLSDSWRSYEPVLASLPPDVHVLAVSQRGHGASDRPVTGYQPADYAGDVVALLDARGISRAVLVGHSSSTLTARLVAGTHPLRTAGLVLIASPLTLRGHAVAAEMARTAFDVLEDPVPAELVREFVTSTVGPSVPASFLETMLTESAKAPARVWRETFHGLLAHDAARHLLQISAPTLLVWGDADDIVTAVDQEALLSALPAARLLVYAGAGHSPHWEQPERFARDLAHFTYELRS